jgi:hypothetical protein
VDKGAGHEDPCSHCGAGGQTDDGVAQAGVVATSQHEQGDVGGPHGGVGQGEDQPPSPKASGTHSDVTSKAAMAAKRTTRTPPSSGSTTLVIQA